MQFSKDPNPWAAWPATGRGRITDLTARRRQRTSKGRGLQPLIIATAGEGKLAGTAEVGATAGRTGSAARRGRAGRPVRQRHLVSTLHAAHRQQHVWQLLAAAPPPSTAHVVQVPLPLPPLPSRLVRRKRMCLRVTGPWGHKVPSAHRQLVLKRDLGPLGSAGPCCAPSSAQRPVARRRRSSGPACGSC